MATTREAAPSRGYWLDMIGGRPALTCLDCGRRTFEPDHVSRHYCPDCEHTHVGLPAAFTGCEDCRMPYPPELLSDMAIGIGGTLSYRRVCGICALARTNAIHTGAPPRARFNGGGAERMRQLAIAWRKQRGYPG